jgi:glycosyltransferase involved in cell wall biosynthesis
MAGLIPLPGWHNGCSGEAGMASVDVAVPCYQYGRYLRDSVGSVLRQGFDEIRVLIIDNASTDNSLEIAHALSAEDGRVQVVAHARNVGHLASFNEGIEWARADYFMILCADDLVAPGAFKRAISLMEAQPDINLTFGREFTVFSDSAVPDIEQPSNPFDWRLMSGDVLVQRLCETGRPDASRFMIPGTTALVRAAVQKQVGYYKDTLPHTSDLDMWLRFGCFGGAAATQAIQGIRRVHPHNRSASLPDCHSWNRHWEAAFDAFFALEGAAIPNATRWHRRARRALAERAYWGVASNLLRGDYALSLKLLSFALTRCPEMAMLPPVGYLFRQKDTAQRVRNVLSTATPQ